MKAVCWCGANKVQVETVPDPTIINPQDAIIQVTLSGIGGADLQLYEGHIPSTEKGDILGHEFMGTVVEVGTGVKSVRVGDRVVIPSSIACGKCEFCEEGKFALCDNSNPNAAAAEKIYGYSGAAFFGYSHLLGGYAGGQAEYVRVPYADVNAFRVPLSIGDENLLLLSDILPTSYMAAENCGIRPGDTVAVWGCGPTGQFAIQCAYLLGAERVIAIDRCPDRLRMAEEIGGAHVINYEKVENTLEELRELTGGSGPEACIDAIGMEAHGSVLDAWYDRVKQTLRLEREKPNVLAHVIQSCKKGGTVSLPGIYGGFINCVPFESAFNKGLTLKMGAAHARKYMEPLLGHIERGDLIPAEVITDRFTLEDAPVAYELLRKKEGECIKVVLRP